ncbi:MAG TPA: CoA-binding protein, partial [Acidimicrobiia bacterium]|nr:CoA-binding protein [Acidimicrobiia bacterium]
MTPRQRRPGREGHSLDGIFRPRSVAVIGASRREGAIGRQVVANIVKAGFTGPVYPVNHHADTVLSILAYASIADIPGPVDLAVLVVPADAAVRAAEQCGRKGVKGLVVVTAGFNEIGGKGTARERRLLAIARKYGMRVIGPNCMGIINSEPAYRLDASFAAIYPGEGRVAMVSQSGALGESILSDAASHGLGVAMFASVGNR